MANGLGNLVNRSPRILKRLRSLNLPDCLNELLAVVTGALRSAQDCFDVESSERPLQETLVSIWRLVDRANQYVDQTAPFKLAKDPTKAQRLDEVLYNLAEVCRVLAVLLSPFLPATATKIYVQ